MEWAAASGPVSVFPQQARWLNRSLDGVSSGTREKIHSSGAGRSRSVPRRSAALMPPIPARKGGSFVLVRQGKDVASAGKGFFNIFRCPGFSLQMLFSLFPVEK